MIFYTASGSAYEVDYKTSKIRRLNAGVSQTARFQVVDGMFREYHYLSPIAVGRSAMIILAENAKEHDEGRSCPGTQTSEIVRVSF